MKRVLGWIAKSSLIVIVLAIGVISLLAMQLTKPQAEVNEDSEKATMVRAYEIEPRRYQVRVTTHGTSRAGRVWRPAAENAARVVERAENFEPGELVREGTVIVQLDSSEHRFTIEQLEAEIEIQELRTRQAKANLETQHERLLNMQRQLEITADRYRVILDLSEQGAESVREAERMEQQWIRESNEVSQIRDAYTELQTQIALDDAQMKKLNAKLADAKHRLSKSTVTMPFDGICAERNVETDEFLTVGQVLGEFVSVARTDVEVFLEVNSQMLYDGGQLGSHIVNRGGVENEPVAEKIELPAEVRLVSQPEVVFRGTARRARFTDPNSRTLPVTIEVDEPYATAAMDRPALSPNLFCEVTILGRWIENAYVIPREAMRGSSVQLVREGKLVTLDVSDSLIQDEVIVVERGIENGDLVVISEIFPAVENMPLQARMVADPTRPLEESGTGRHVRNDNGNAIR